MHGPPVSTKIASNGRIYLQEDLCTSAILRTPMTLKSSDGSPSRTVCPHPLTLPLFHQPSLPPLISNFVIHLSMHWGRAWLGTVPRCSRNALPTLRSLFWDPQRNVTDFRAYTNTHPGKLWSSVPRCLTHTLSPKPPLTLT